MKKVYIMLLILSVAVVSSCGITKKDLGFARQGPDASAVKTNEPLILPPEYSSRPKTTAIDIEENEGFYE